MIEPLRHTSHLSSLRRPTRRQSALFRRKNPGQHYRTSAASMTSRCHSSSPTVPHLHPPHVSLDPSLANPAISPTCKPYWCCRSFLRWMPHINLLYPFWEDSGSNLQDAAERIQEALAEVPPFKVSTSTSEQAAAAAAAAVMAARRAAVASHADCPLMPY